MQIDCVIDDREMIIQAVFDGILGAEHITMEEIQEIEENLFEEICDMHTPFAAWDTIQ
jgi:uncharacterized protein (DUF2267 family)